MNAHITRLTLLALLCGLVACGSTGPTRSPLESPHAVQSHFDPTKDPYWEDPRWDAALLSDVQSMVHNPVDASDLSTPTLQATVKFTFSNGTIEYPEIVQSTGDPELDKLMLHQVASAPAPQPSGPYAAEPHEFSLQLDMPTPYETFEYSVYATIDAAKVYSKDAVIAGDQGMTTVDFDYLDGIASNVTITKSSSHKALDQPSVRAVSTAQMPAPSVYAGKTLHMEVVFCYALYESFADHSKCPVAKNVIQVTGTRIRMVEYRGL